MFGQGGSSQLTGAGGTDLSSFDDVLWLQEIMLTGTITRAELSIAFLETPKSGSSDAESFFDFSGGFEDFALLSTADAILLEEAAIGVTEAPSGVTFESTESATGAIGAAAPVSIPDPVVSEGTALASPPAAPAPPWMVVAGLAGLLLLKTGKARAHASA